MASKKTTKTKTKEKTRAEMEEEILLLVEDWDLDTLFGYVKGVKEDEIKELDDAALKKLYREEVLGEEVSDG